MEGIMSESHPIFFKNMGSLGDSIDENRTSEMGMPPRLRIVWSCLISALKTQIHDYLMNQFNSITCWTIYPFWRIPLENGRLPQAQYRANYVSISSLMQLCVFTIKVHNGNLLLIYDNDCLLTVRKRYFTSVKSF